MTEQSSEPTAEGLTENIETILAEIEDWGRALLTEHEHRACEHQSPTVESKYTGQSLIQYVERLREAFDQHEIDNSLQGETAWDTKERRVSTDPTACRNCGYSITVYDPTCCHILGCRDCRRSEPRKCIRNATFKFTRPDRAAVEGGRS